MRHTLWTIFVAALAAVGFFAPNLARADATQPAAGPILVLPFATPSGANDAWIGKAVQQDLLTDLTQGTVARVLAPASAPPAADQDAALAAARQAGAAIVVYGQAQTTGKEVRLSGQVLDANDGKALAAIKATGPTDELFHLEDALAGQVFMGLPHNLLTAQTQQAMQNMAARQAQQGANPQQQPQQQWPNGPYANPELNPGNIYGGASQPTTGEPQYVSSPPVYDGGTTYNYYTYTTPDYGSYFPAYGYGYPGWGYAYPSFGWWPFWGSTFFVFDGFHHHDFDDFHHHFDGNGHNGTFNHNGNGNFNHNGFGNGSTFAHSGFGAGSPRGNGGSFGARTSPRFSTGGFSAAGRIGGGSAFHSAGISGGIRGGGGGFHGGGFGGGGFHGGGFSGGGMHGGGGGGGGHR